MKDRIYICHTYYHAYISFLKEFYIREKEAKEGKIQSEASIVLSRLSNNFENSKERYKASGVFAEVFDFDERREDSYPELDKLRQPGNIIKNLFNRMRLMSEFSKATESVVDIDYKEYKDIYVFCDMDPIGIYLTKHKIPYHAVEDGLNTLKYIDLARFQDRKLFKLKRFLSKKLNLIFMPNGLAKYCIDMEVNDLSEIKYPCKNYVELSRKMLSDRLTADEKKILLKAFIKDYDGLKNQIDEMGDEDKILILTDPLCSLDIREQIFKDIIKMYEPEGRIFLKPHPRDVLDYDALFPDYPKIDASVPMEILNLFDNLHFKKAVGVLTEMKAITFADEAVRLGADFMDKYEAPEIHRQNEII